MSDITTNKDERSYFDESLSKPDNWAVFEQERLAGDFSDFVRSVLVNQSIPQAVLASRLKKSAPVISRALKKGSNLTIRSLVDLAAAVGYQIVRFDLQPIPNVVADWWQSATTNAHYVIEGSEFSTHSTVLPTGAAFEWVENPTETVDTHAHF